MEKRKTRGNGCKKYIGFCLFGILLNYVISLLAAIFNIPLYLDCIGTIVAAAFCGGLPAIIVAFVSAILCSINNPLNLYFGIPAILFAWCAVTMFRRGMLKRWYGWPIMAICLAVIGGLTSSVIGWYTFGEQINGVAAPLAFSINEMGISEFYAQMSAELILELIDKLITILISAGLIYLLAKKWKIVEREKQFKHSVNRRMTVIVIATVSVVGIFSTIIGSVYYENLLHNNTINNVEYSSAQAALCINGNMVEKQLTEGEQSVGYAETKQKINDLYMNLTDIRYLYVYVIKDGKCYVLYDADVFGEEGQKVGVVVANDPDIYDRIEEFEKGGDITPGYGNSQYGTMISAYTPIYDSNGKTVAYACADGDVSIYIQNMLIYIIQFATFVFAIILLTVLLMVAYVNRRITKPIQAIVEQTRALEHVNVEDWLDSEAWANRVPIQTDDELEELYQTVTTAERNASINVKKRLETERELLQTREFEVMNKKLEKMIQEADEANNAKTEFLSRMSHDMRTPMNAIIGLSALTLDESDKPEIVRENMGKIQASSDFLLGLVNDILDLAKIEDGSVILNPQPYTYMEFLNNMQTMFQAQCDAKGVTLTIQMPPTNPMIRVDKMRLNQIFFNVLSNAVKYTPVGGKIDYSVENYELVNQQISVDFVIKDTGIGMSKEYLQHLFEPFVQENSEVTPELQGSGLGLSITKQLVDLMGGSIDIQSQKEVGTTVRIHLNFECINANVQESVQTQVVQGDDRILQEKHVLLAEDHPLNAQIARKLLEKKGMKVTHAKNGKVAVDLFRSSKAGYFDAILMDIRMPELSGLEATRQIRAMSHPNSQSVIIIAMSANAYPEDVKKSLDAGMNGHLAKPVSPELLYDTLVEQFQKREG